MGGESNNDKKGDGDGGGVRIGWVKLGKVWWPGKVVEEGQFSSVFLNDVSN